MKNSSKKGFTLIELLVVIAIIAILAAILFPVFAKARGKARQAKCLSNCKQIGLAFLMYTEDYDGKFPLGRWAFNQDAPNIGQPWSLIVPYIQGGKYTIDVARRTVLKCDSVADAGLLPTWLTSNPAYSPDLDAWYHGSSYAYNADLSPWWGASEGNHYASGFGLYQARIDGTCPTRSVSEIANSAGMMMFCDGFIDDVYVQWGGSGGMDASSGRWVVQGCYPAHNAGVNIGFCDGHAKWWKGNARGWWGNIPPAMMNVSGYDGSDWFGPTYPGG